MSMDSGRVGFRRRRLRKNDETDVEADEHRLLNRRYERSVNDDKYVRYADDLDMDEDESDSEQYFAEEHARRNIRINDPSHRGQSMKTRRREDEEVEYAGRLRGGIGCQNTGTRYAARKRAVGIGMEVRNQGNPKHIGLRGDDGYVYGGKSYGLHVEADKYDDGGITYQSNVQTVVKTIRSLTLAEEHIEFLMKTPFWWFVKAALDMNDINVYKQFRKNNFIITKMLKRFHREGRKLGFKFGDVFLVPNRDEFVLIFGLNCGNRVVCPGGGTVKVTSFLQRCFPQKLDHMAAAEGTHYKMTPTLLLDTLTEKINSGEPDVGEDIARLMHLYLLAAFFMPNRGSCLSWRLTETIDKFEDMCEYDWGSFVFEDLMQDINNNRNLKIGGCSIFLLFWLCERTFAVSPVRGCSKFPRFLKWDLVAMGRVMGKMDFDNLTRYTDVKRRLTSTAEEVDLLRLQDDISDDEEEDCFILEKNAADVRVANDKGKGKVSECQFHGEYRVPLMKRVKSGSMSSHETTSFEQLMSHAPGPPSFDLLEQTQENDGGILPTENANKVAVNKVKWSNPLVKEVRLGVSMDALVDSGRNLFPDDTAERVEGGDARIKELELELGNARASIESLKKELENKDIANMAVADVILDEEINDLKKRLAESEKVRSRLGAFRHEDAKKIEKISHERWQYRHDLEREKVVNIGLKEEKEKLAKLEAEHNHRKFQLITENDRLAAELATALKVIADAGLSMDGNSVIPGGNEVGMTQMISEKSVSGSQSGGQNIGAASSTPVSDGNLVPSQHQSDHGSQSQNSKTVGNGNSKAVSNESGGRQSDGSTFLSPLLDKSKCETGPAESSDTQGSGSVDKPNSMILRVQERTKLNARKKTDLGTPIPISIVGRSSNVDSSSQIRTMSVDRLGIAFRSTFPFVSSWLDDKFRTTRPCDSILQLGNSQLANYITLANIEAILNSERIDEAVIDIWGLMISQKVAAENTARANRLFVARQIYLFHSYCWINVARIDVSGPYAGRVCQLIDKKIEDALNHDLWIFPICTTAGLDPMENEGTRWTLLTYCVADGKWIFLQSSHANNT